MFDNQKVKDMLARLASDDDELGGELRERLNRPVAEVAMAPRLGVRGGPSIGGPPMMAETIVLRTGRPVLAIKQNTVELEFRDADSQVWKQRLINAKGNLAKPILAVGRIDLVGHPDYEWVGTGWLVRPDILATNRHVAGIFARSSGDRFTFRLGAGGRPISASIDFLREVGNAERRAHQIQDVLHIEDEDGPDLALLRVSSIPDATPILLSTDEPKEKTQVAVIGYPARDSRLPDQDLMEELFGNVYDRKRLAPGQIKGIENDMLLHDCSTLGGNSGSVVLDLASGKALGIHFAGRFLESNFAVPASVIEDRVQTRERPNGRRSTPAPSSSRHVAAPATPTVAAQPVAATPVSNGAGKFECVIPLKLTFEVGTPIVASAAVATAVATPASPIVTHLATYTDAGEDDILLAPEAAPSAYLDRKGYQPNFLGADIPIALPKITRDAGQIVQFNFNGNPRETELRYLHFSVLMHRARRMCFFSAVNIDGKQSKKTKRPGWAFDPRIPKELQIMKECYGEAPRFSRGHMTRREDPAWGSADVAQRGNADSMHVTNTVPQMQTFNGGIWLGLEDYALQNAREDDMKICVITGPVFHRQDPVMFGIKVPRVFWKVIAFIHDQSGKLSATGYSISQEKFLSEDEFVFGAYETHQRSLKWIEQKAGVSFGALTARDQFEDANESFETPLRDFSRIRFA